MFVHDETFKLAKVSCGHEHLQQINAFQPVASILPHYEAAKHSAVNVALLWLANKGVLHGSVPHEHCIAGCEGGHVYHCPCLAQQLLCPLLLCFCACIHVSHGQPDIREPHNVSILANEQSACPLDF